MIQALLKIEDLKTHFFTYNEVVRAVDGVSLHVSREEILGILGEPGCGKSVTMRSVLRLIPEPGRIVSGACCPRTPICWRWTMRPCAGYAAAASP